MSSIRNWLKGKKSYIMAVIGVLGAVVAWGDGQIDLMALLASIWAAGTTVFLRAGVAKGNKN